jgi:hypothetical protein
MSAKTVTPEDPGPEPAWFSELFIGAGVLVFAARDYVRDGEYSRTALNLTYEGYQDDLLSAGVITEAMLVPPGKGKHYRDPNGRNVRISRRWLAKDGEPFPFRYLRVTRHMTTEELPRWPQGLQALAAYDRHADWNEALAVYLRAGVNASAPPESAAPPTATKPPTFLRLVVDNTRVRP